MRDPSEANPLDYVEGGPLNARREELSAWLDATSPDLTAFHRRGGKMIVAIGTNDTLASPGEQLDYYQSLIDTMGQSTLDAFARLVRAAADGSRPDRHELHARDGDGQNDSGRSRFRARFDRLTLLTDWVERADRARALDRRLSRQSHAADLLVSGVSALRVRAGGCRGVVSV